MNVETTIWDTDILNKYLNKDVRCTYFNWMSKQKDKIHIFWMNVFENKWDKIF